jgi:hypothetical protein
MNTIKWIFDHIEFIGLVILIPITHYWVFIKGPKERDED